jgi:hypothetical protein
MAGANIGNCVVFGSGLCGGAGDGTGAAIEPNDLGEPGSFRINASLARPIEAVALLPAVVRQAPFLRQNRVLSGA